MSKKPIDLNEAIQKTKRVYNMLPPSARPRKASRSILNRTPEESKALARAVYHSVKTASDEGLIVRVPRGFRMLWTSEKS